MLLFKVIKLHLFGTAVLLCSLSWCSLESCVFRLFSCKERMVKRTVLVFSLHTPSLDLLCLTDNVFFLFCQSMYCSLVLSTKAYENISLNYIGIFHVDMWKRFLKPDQLHSHLGGRILGWILAVTTGESSGLSFSARVIFYFYVDLLHGQSTKLLRN